MDPAQDLTKATAAAVSSTLIWIIWATATAIITGQVMTVPHILALAIQDVTAMVDVLDPTLMIVSTARPTHHAMLPEDVCVIQAGLGINVLYILAPATLTVMAVMDHLLMSVRHVLHTPISTITMSVLVITTGVE